MLQMRCTGKVLKELGKKPKQLSEIKEPNSTLGHWYVNISTIDRRKVFLFVNERTLLSFIIFGINKSNVQKTHKTFLSGLDQLLTLEGIDPKIIDKVINEYANIEYTKTDSKSVLGSMTDLMWLYKDHIYSDGGLKYCDVGKVIFQLNRMPQRNIDGGYSIELVKEILLS